MKRALIAALLSGLVLPGLGQLYNRRLGRGLAFIMTMSGLLIALALTVFFKMGQAVETLSLEEATGQGRWTAVSQAFVKLDLTWLGIVVGIMVLVWAISVIDAFRDGRRPRPPQPE